MGPEADGTAWALSPTARFAEQCPGPLLKPSAASTLAVLPPGGQAQPSSMTATIDPDAVPGLRDVFEARLQGRVLDTKTSWYVRSQEEVPPFAILHVRFPEVDVALNVVFDVRQFAHQLIAAAASGRVTLIDPLLEQALQTKPVDEAMRDGLFVDLLTFEREPLVRILQQYFDQPLNAPDNDLLSCPRAESPEEMAAFAKEARVPSAYGASTWPGMFPVLFFVDEDVAGLMREMDGDEVPVAVWKVLRDDEHALARLDVSIAERRVASWLVCDPAMQVVRAAASGPHAVVILSEPPSENEQRLREQYAAAALVTVPMTSVAIRTLLSEDAGASSP
jgi:hypothetical protein